MLSVMGTTGYVYRSRQSEERLRAVEIVRQSEGLLKESQQVASLGHYTFDIRSGEWTSSEGLDRVFGIGPAYARDVAGWTGLVHPDDRQMMQAYLLEDVIGRGQPFDKEYRIVRSDDGQTRWVRGLGRLALDERGQAITMFGTIQDVTQRRLAEEELRQRNEELLRFVYTVSHDLKSPLVTIRTFLGFLGQDLGKDDPVLVETDMEHIRRAAERMARLLDELLELSRVGRKMNPPQDVLLQDLVSETLTVVAGLMADKRAEVHVTDVPVVLRGDRARLLEVFQNLIDNALKFTRADSHPRIDVGIEDRADGLAFFVRDNGVGIDPRHKAKLFGMFEKLHPGTEGTGIGLALVKRIVEVHGGRVWAESPGPDQGTTFYFTLADTTRA
jgi:PAS domain S-box-containing protein